MIQLLSVKIGTSTLDVSSKIKNVPADQPIQILFSSAVDTSSIVKVISISDSLGTAIHYTYSTIINANTITLTPTPKLQYSASYTMAISSALHGLNGETFPGIQFKFATIAGSIVIDSITLNGKSMTTTPLQNIDPKAFNIKIIFSRHCIRPITNHHFPSPDLH